ncbi:hypothetical protein [Pedobacter sp.]
MKKIAIIVLVVFCVLSVLQSCSNKLCPAYSSYPEYKGRKN